MSLDTVVDNPGIRSGRQRYMGKRGEKEKDKSYRLVVKHRYTRTEGGRGPWEVCVQLMRKRRCENKTRESHRTKETNTRRW